MSELVGKVSGAVTGTAGSVLNKGQGLLDRWFPPEKREELMAKMSRFASEKPMLASFLLSQIAITGIPMGLFVVFTLGVLVFSLVAALVIAVLAALLFSAFCIGIALLVLLPVLFITTFGAVFVWLWGVGAYYLLKWFNQKPIPGISKGSEGGKTEKSEIPGESQNGGPRGPPKEKQHGGKQHSEGNKKAKKNGGPLPNVDGVSDVAKTADVGNVTEKVGDVADTDKVTEKVGDVGKVGGAGDKVNDVAGKVGGVPGVGTVKGGLGV
ncbi:MAG: hypothetical protein M1812_002251 [Candelaria pacifica]|nr:MAG: hypothetical protein M1812_002251 [Candelaria pacifica]